LLVLGASLTVLLLMAVVAGRQQWLGEDSADRLRELVLQLPRQIMAGAQVQMHVQYKRRPCHSPARLRHSDSFQQHAQVHHLHPGVERPEHQSERRASHPASHHGMPLALGAAGTSTTRGTPLRATPRMVPSDCKVMSARRGACGGHLEMCAAIRNPKAPMNRHRLRRRQPRRMWGVPLWPRVRERQKQEP